MFKPLLLVPEKLNLLVAVYVFPVECVNTISPSVGLLNLTEFNCIPLSSLASTLNTTFS